MSQILYSWSFSTKKDRSSMWYIIAFACVIWLAIWGFLSGQYGLSFIVILVAWVAFFVENNSSDDIDIQITDIGVKVWESFYDYSKVLSFSFLYEGDQARVLRLKINKKTLATLDLDVENSMVNTLKSILANYVKEDEKWEFSFTDKLIRVTKL